MLRDKKKQIIGEICQKPGEIKALLWRWDLQIKETNNVMPSPLYLFCQYSIVGILKKSSLADWFNVENPVVKICRTSSS